MAPRKAAKHSNTEVLHTAAEAGDVSPSRRKKPITKTANKSEKEEQIRLPRAAKSAKTEQSETTDTSSVVTKNAKAKGKTTSLPKNASMPAKADSKVKTTVKRNKETIEKGDAGIPNMKTVKSSEETEPKKTRAKAATKKAGIDADQEQKGISRGKTKKVAATESVESLEAPVVKKRKPANAEAKSKESEPKGRAMKRKNESATNVKGKGSSSKAKTTANSKLVNDIEAGESTLPVKTNKKANDDKTTKSVVARKTRGREKKASPEDKDDEDFKDTEEEASEPAQTSDTKDQDSQDDQLETTELIQLPKRGKNTRKKEVAAPQKKATKGRGKTAKSNIETASNEDDAEPIKTVKQVQKKTRKEATNAAPPPKKSRRRKGAAATAEDENDEKPSEDVAENEETLDMSEAINSNNVNEKLSEEDNDKGHDSEKEETTYNKTVGMLKKTEETTIIKTEINENNVTSIS